MQITSADIDKAHDWLTEQRTVVHPGPIEVLREALNFYAAHVRGREQNERLVAQEQ